MNKMKQFSLGLGYLIGVNILYAEILNVEQNKTLVPKSLIVQERDVAIEKASKISKNMMAQAELEHIKVIAKADKDKTISDAEAIKLQNIAKVEAIKKATITEATEKAKKEIYEINKEVDAIKVNANYLYNQKIKEAEKKLNPMLSIEKKPNSADIHTLLKNNQIKFVSGTQKLTKKSIMQIKKIAQLLKGTNKHLRIAGYTDSDGSSVLNKKLSLARANNVKKVLVSEGMIARNIISIGYGEEHPLVPNTNSKNKAINRRIEMKIVK